jgi:hypothetical protein
MRKRVEANRSWAKVMGYARACEAARAHGEVFRDV